MVRKHFEITIPIDIDQLPRYSDAGLATRWHVAQANPVPISDPEAGELAEAIGREIIRRWLKATAPELYAHQGRHYYWDQLRQMATYKPGSEDVQDPEWSRGIWVPRAAEASNGQ